MENMEKMDKFEKSFHPTNPKLTQYVVDTFQPEDAVLAEFRTRTEAAGLPPIQVGKVDGRHLEILVRMCDAKKIVEIGTLGGYSALCLARGLPSDGKILSIEMDPHHAKVARENLKRAGETRVEILEGVALERLPELESQGPFDFVFIDADKESYPAYLTWCEENLRLGGVVAGDNTFGFGLVAQDTFENEEQEATARAVREFNSRLAAPQGRFRSTLFPTGEGLTVGVKVK